MAAPFSSPSHFLQAGHGGQTAAFSEVATDDDAVALRAPAAATKVAAVAAASVPTVVTTAVPT